MATMTNDLEFYETPAAFVRWLFYEVQIAGRVAEVCVGDGAIIKASMIPMHRPGAPAPARQWVTNDLDPRWPADYHLDAAKPELYEQMGDVDWVISNPPFTPAIEIITRCLAHAKVGVAMHLRASIHEVLKTGIRRTWMADHTPTGILWLPRFAYQRSQKTGKWTTDSVCACWVIWLKPTRAVEVGYGPRGHGQAFDKPAEQFIRYAPEWVIDELDRDTPAYRTRMDRLMEAR